MNLKRSHSVGHVEYGNNKFFEVMMEGDEVCFVNHNDGPDGQVENDDGTWESEGLSLDEFIQEIADRPDFQDIMDEVNQLIDK